MKKLILTMLSLSIFSTSYALQSQVELNLIKNGETLLEQKSDLLNSVLDLKDQIEDQKNKRKTNYAGAIASGAVLVFAVNGYKKYISGDSFTGFYRAFFGSVGIVAAAGTSYNTYKISVRSEHIETFEKILDEKISELERQIRTTQVLLNTLEE
jgi:vacuolar-type H+-ATPase subunit D/Vma8